jgi:hypothetical protein
MPPVVKDPFAYLLEKTAPHVFTLMYVPMLYRTTYHLLQEKQTRHTLHSIGLHSTPYWLSWLAYHTAINTIISTTAATLLTPLFSKTSTTIVFVVFFVYGETLFGYVVVV